MTIRALTVAASLGAVTLAMPVAAQTINWADLTTTDGSTYAQGTIAVGATSVGVGVTGAGFSFVQTGASSDTNFWADRYGSPNAFVIGGTNDQTPPTTDIVAFNSGGLKTITFDTPVSDVYLALVSWNGNSGVFDQPFEVISQGCGYWGCGTFTSVTPTSFVADGELHGIIRFTGTFTSVSFTDQTENWHGIEVGIAGLASDSGVPELSTWAMMLAGFGVAGYALRRRPRAAIHYA